MGAEHFGIMVGESVQVYAPIPKREKERFDQVQHWMLWYEKAETFPFKPEDEEAFVRDLCLQDNLLQDDMKERWRSWVHV